MKQREAFEQEDVQLEDTAIKQTPNMSQMQPSEVNPSANPSSSICSGKSDDDYDAAPPKDLLDQEFEIQQISKPPGRDKKV